MEHNMLVDIIFKKAMAQLQYDDAYPDVGMGMSYTEAIELACKETFAEAARWNSIEALGLQFTDELKSDVWYRLRGAR